MTTSLLSSLKTQSPNAGPTLAMPLTVIRKALDKENPANDYFEVADEKGNKFALVTRGERTPLKEVKVFVSGVVVAEGVYQENGSETHASGLPVLNSRYVTCPVPDAKSGTVMTAVARVARKGTKDDPSAVVEVLMPATEVTTLAEARAAFVDAIEKHRDSIGWPGVIINVTDGEVGESRTFGAATVGEAGKKRVAPADAQAAAFDGKPAEFFGNLFEKMAATPGHDGKVLIVPVMKLNMGKDSSDNAKTDSALGGKGGHSNFARFHPRETIEIVKSDGTKGSFERLMYTPMVIGIQYAKTDEGGRDPSRTMVVKVVPAFDERTRETASITNLRGLPKLFEAIAGPVPISAEPAEPRTAGKAAQAAPHAPAEDESEEFNLDELEASLLGEGAGPGV